MTDLSKDARDWLDEGVSSDAEAMDDGLIGIRYAHYIEIDDHIETLTARVAEYREAQAAHAGIAIKNVWLKNALRDAKHHIEHMAAWIGKQNGGYSFEALGEDMPGIDLALTDTPDIEGEE